MKEVNLFPPLLLEFIGERKVSRQKLGSLHTGREKAPQGEQEDMFNHQKGGERQGQSSSLLPYLHSSKRKVLQVKTI
jgi:hypothetical protein